MDSLSGMCTSGGIILELRKAEYLLPIGGLHFESGVRDDSPEPIRGGAKAQ